MNSLFKPGDIVSLRLGNSVITWPDGWDVTRVVRVGYDWWKPAYQRVETRTVVVVGWSVYRSEFDRLMTRILLEGEIIWISTSDLENWFLLVEDLAEISLITEG